MPDVLVRQFLRSVLKREPTEQELALCRKDNLDYKETLSRLIQGLPQDQQLEVLSLEMGKLYSQIAEMKKSMIN